jgi:hypothetical protein
VTYRLNVIVVSLLLNFVLGMASYSQANSSCADIFRAGTWQDREFNSRFKVIDSEGVGPKDFSALHPNVQPRDSLGLDLRMIAPNENRIVIGIEERKHVFMVIGNVRFDGRIFHNAQSVAFNSEIPVGQGVFAILEGVPPAVVNHLRQLVSTPSGEAYMGCGHAVLAKLKEVGIAPSPKAGFVIETSKIFDILASGDLTWPNGMRIRTQLYRTAGIDPAKLQNQLRRYDEKVLSDIARKFRGLSPDEVVVSITGHERPISGALRQYLSHLTGAP